MKRKLLMLVLALFITTQCALSTFASAPQYLSSETAVLMDAETGQVLYEKHKDQPMHPASITKIMTGLLASEYCDLEEEMTVSKSALDISPNSTRIWLQEGEKLSVDEGLFSLMIASANDSANVLAEHVAGTQEQFVELMNQRSKEIGAVNTNFKNAHGLTDNEHITTAYDMALITREAIKNSNFLKHFNVSNHTVPSTNKTGNRYLSNHHTLINTGQWEPSLELVGGKTGYTNSAGNTLVTVVEKDGQTLIAVVLKSSGGIISDTQQLFNYGFQDFEKYSVPTTYLVEPILPLMNKELTQIGEAEVQLPEAVNILLPKYMESGKLRTEVTYPESLREDGEEPLTLRLYLDKGLPLLEVALDYDVTMFEKVETQTEIAEKYEERESGTMATLKGTENLLGSREKAEASTAPIGISFFFFFSILLALFMPLLLLWKLHLAE